VKSRSRRVPGVARESGMVPSLVLSCNIRLFVIDIDYGYRYLHEVYSELSYLYFVIWLCYHLMLAMVNILALELWQVIQYRMFALM